MSYSGDGGIQPDSALALGDEEAQEHTKCVDTILGRLPSAGATFLENKRSQPASIKPAGFLSKPLEQLPNVTTIVAEGHIAGTPLLVHPLTEGRQQTGIMNGGFDRADDPSISQVGQEQAHTMDHFQLIRVGVVLAVASTQVAPESRQQLLVQLMRRHALPMSPMDEVFRRSEVVASGNRGVARLR